MQMANILPGLKAAPYWYAKFFWIESLLVYEGTLGRKELTRSRFRCHRATF